MLMLVEFQARLAGAPQPIQASQSIWEPLVRGRDGPRFMPPVCGTVYGTLLNHRDALAALGEQVHAPPYKAPPNAPILHIKPRNTLVGHREPIVVPPGELELAIGGTLGVVIGRTASRVSAAQALEFVAGYTVVNDISVPHASLYRPALRFTCCDGFCPIGPWIVPRARVPDPDALGITVCIDGASAQRSNTAGLIRPVAKLLADVTDFMTLHPGDVLCVGVAARAPRARAGQRVSIRIDRVGVLENTLVRAGQAFATVAP